MGGFREHMRPLTLPTPSAITVKDPALPNPGSEEGYIGLSPSSYYQNPNRTGNFPTPPGRILELTDQGSWALVAGDASAAYRYGMATYSAGTQFSTGIPRSSFLWPGVMDYLNKYDATYNATFAQPLMVRNLTFNPLDFAIRTLVLVRGAQPYVIVHDNVRKDNTAQSWRWSINSAEGFAPGLSRYFVDSAGRGVYSSLRMRPNATRSEAHFWHSPIDDAAGRARLMVRDLGQHAADPSQPAIFLDSRPPGQNISYLTYGIDNNNPNGGYVRVQTNRIIIQRDNVVTPDYTVLLFPYMDGSPLPTTTWNGDRSVLSVLFADGTLHSVSFARNQPDNRTRISQHRADDDHGHADGRIAGLARIFPV
ncbi:hypothetical protein DFJ74DRAFT_696608 [Hyaloraphidium curvatum]|nr:hypothetical protein DFJ74DRAFT_696608 [Hyaloraphidium curvatum]